MEIGIALLIFLVVLFLVAADRYNRTMERLGLHEDNNDYIDVDKALEHEKRQFEVRYWHQRNLEMTPMSVKAVNEEGAIVEFLRKTGLSREHIDRVTPI